jgi:dCTP deaminase
MSTIVDHQIWTLAQTHQMIDEFNPEQLNPASYDVRLGSEILVEGHGFGPEETRKRWHKISIDEKVYWLSPGQFVLGVTMEYVKIPSSIEAVFQLKSSRGREGYEHALAGYIDPGFEGRITLELSNLNQRHNIPLVKGMLIGQLRFMKLDAIPSRTYSETGHYHKDESVQPSKVDDMLADRQGGYGTLVTANGETPGTKN